MAQRANAQIVQVKASHPSMISRPDAAVDLIERAARAVAARGAITLSIAWLRDGFSLGTKT